MILQNFTSSLFTRTIKQSWSHFSEFCLVLTLQKLQQSSKHVCIVQILLIVGHGFECLSCTVCSNFNGWWMLVHLLSKGGSQFTLTSQWESRNVKTSPLASEAPSSLVRMSPSRFLVRTILTLPKRTMYSSSFSFKCSRKKGKKNISGARPGGANRKIGWHITCKQLIYFHLSSLQVLQNLPQILPETVWKV